MESSTLTNSIPVIQCDSLTRMDAPNYEGSDRVTWKIVEYPSDDILLILVLYIDGEEANATLFDEVSESIKGPQDLQDALKVYYRKWWESLPKGEGYDEKYDLNGEETDFIDFEEVNMFNGVEVNMVDNTPQYYQGEIIFSEEEIANLYDDLD